MTERLWELSLAHLSLSLWALTLGATLSLPLGVLASRRPRLERAVLGVASVIQTIPGLALLAAMVPALAALSTIGLEVPSIGALPAVLGLTLYSLLPMLRNTVVGLAEVDPASRRAAKAVGMTAAQSLRQVELPLAAPTIVAGLRTAAVWTVGMATLATPVGAQSLGDLIFAGLQTRDHGSVLLGCAGSAALALTLDGLLRAIGPALAGRRRGLGLAAAVALGLLVIGSLARPFVGGSGASGAAVRIGAKPFTEQYVLAELLASRARAVGAETRVASSLGSTVAFDALVAGDLDLYVEYTGTVWSSMMHREGPAPSREALADEVEAWLLETHGVRVAARLGFENAYALAVRSPSDSGPDITRISQLAPLAPGFTMAGDYELFGRAEWDSITSTYGLDFREQRTMDPTLLYPALAQGEVDVIGAYTTEGRVDAFGLRVLEDDRDAIPPYDAIVLTRPGFADDAPAVFAALEELNGAIDDDAMRVANRSVDVDGRSPEEAAATLLGGR